MLSPFRRRRGTCRHLLQQQLPRPHQNRTRSRTLDITNDLAGKNRLMVLVENNRPKGDVPGTMHDWWPDGGIVRPGRIFRRPSDVRIGEATIETTLKNQDEADLCLRVLIESASGWMSSVSIVTSGSAKGLPPKRRTASRTLRGAPLYLQLSLRPATTPRRRLSRMRGAPKTHQARPSNLTRRHG